MTARWKPKGTATPLEHPAQQQHLASRRPAELAPTARKRPRLDDAAPGPPVDHSHSLAQLPFRAGRPSDMTGESAVLGTFRALECSGVSDRAWRQLHNEVLDEAEQQQPTPKERQMRSRAFFHAQNVIQDVFPHARVASFGSYATGLDLRSSDIDIVILNLMQPNGPDGGFTASAKRVVNEHLARLKTRLAQAGRQRGAFVVRNARIPVLKCTMVDGIELDISINDRRSCDAGETVALFLERWPALRPLTLVVKALVRAADLHDVSRGGLGSFSVFNMCAAFLMEAAKEGIDTEDLGWLLAGFLHFYGVLFDCSSQAISVAAGGVVSQRTDYSPPKMCILDPNTGRDVSGGTRLWHKVAAHFQLLFHRLRGAQLRADPHGHVALLDSIFPAPRDEDPPFPPGFAPAAHPAQHHWGDQKGYLGGWGSAGRQNSAHEGPNGVGVAPYGWGHGSGGWGWGLRPVQQPPVFHGTPPISSPRGVQGMGANGWQFGPQMPLPLPPPLPDSEHHRPKRRRQKDT